MGPTAGWRLPTRNWPACSHQDSIPRCIHAADGRATPWWLPPSSPGHIPDGDQRIRAAGNQLPAVWAPVEVVEGGRGTLHHTHALRTFDLPQPQSAIVTATEEVAAIGGEGQTVHITAMSVQHGPQGAELPIPEPDGVVKAATGQHPSIRTPGHTPHPIRIPRERLEIAPTFDLPQLDGAIPARADENTAIGGKGQAAHPDTMPSEGLHAGGSPTGWNRPQPDRACEVATGEQAPIRAPGQRDDWNWDEAIPPGWCPASDSRAGRWSY